MVDYVHSLFLADRIYRLFMENIKHVLKREHFDDVNSIQATLIYGVGDGIISVGDFKNRGYYLGSNVSYNLKKLMNTDYIKKNQSKFDTRLKYISLTPKGLQLYKFLDQTFQEECKSIQQIDLGLLSKTLKSIEINLVAQAAGY